MGLWWREEVDSTRFVKLFLDGIKQVAGLSKPGSRWKHVNGLSMRSRPRIRPREALEYDHSTYVSDDGSKHSRFSARSQRKLAARAVV